MSTNAGSPTWLSLSDVAAFIASATMRMYSLELWPSSEFEARSDLVEHIEVFYNRKRRHSSLDYLSPSRFEENYRTAAAAARTPCPHHRAR